ncbi:MAG: beta-ketoacyl synthase N-terminal-like domain-containing protein, partial [Nitrospinae bacterium]|nr:beta-ketoacyl synthase N-terminal-like domain-containing protein [Nitrospinota bacterium]
MRGVSIIGAGITPFGVRSESLVALGAVACRNALEDASLGPERIEVFFLGNFAGHAFVGQNHVAPMVAHAAGLGAVPCTRLEGACASGGLAMRQGVLAVASGQVDFALIAGVEKMTCAETDETASILAAAGDVAVEASVGSTFPALFG